MGTHPAQERRNCGLEMDNQILLVGAGPMARAYALVLKDLQMRFEAVCRSEASARAFQKATGSPAVTGGLETWLARNGAPRRAIVAVPVADLAAVSAMLLRAGCADILVEKPAGIEAGEIGMLAALAEDMRRRVIVAYNRRFLASVRKARALALEDGGVRSFIFEFTELADKVRRLPYPPSVLANWEIANSTHVIDTAFFLGGEPEHVSGSVSGDLPWHPRCARFFGHGRTRSGADFAYFADWEAPGRWGIEINTVARRLILRPLETLQVQRRGMFTIEPMEIDDTLDKAFKPGLHRQVQAWMGGEGADDLIDIGEHHRRIVQYTRSIMCEQG